MSTYQRKRSLSHIIPTSVHWKHINVTSSDNGRKIVQDANGIINPGEMCAIMGSSGAGKTTLLNTLAYHNIGNGGTTRRGNVFVNGNDIGKKMADVSAFCQQEDLFIGALTVREHLTFHANLRNVMFAERRIEQVIEEMGLKTCADTRIGTVGMDKTISGGERKRLSFGTHILVQPAILFADEPTSGLDAHLAKSVVKSLQSIARKGTSILCTIHQPSSDAFQLFDKLLLLSHGRTIYFGRSHDTLMRYFSQRLMKPCPVNYNPADHYIKSTGTLTPSDAKNYAEIWLTSESAKHFDRETRAVSHMPPISSTLKRASLWQQFYWLLWRSLIMTYRDPMVSIARIAQALVIGVLLAGIYFRNPPMPYIGLTGGSNSSTGIHEDINQINGATFTLTAVMSMNYVFFVITVFPRLAPIWGIEYYSRLYNIPMAFLASNFAELPLLLLIPLIFLAPTYWMMGFYPYAKEFFAFYGILTLMSNTALSFGLMGSMFSDNVQVVTELVPGMMLPLLCFGGFVLPIDSIPGYIRWVKYLSWFPFTTEALMINQWSNVNFHCEFDGIVYSYDDCPDPRLRLTGTELIRNIGFDESNMGFDIAMLLTQFFVYRILALLIVTIKFYVLSNSDSWCVTGSKNLKKQLQKLCYCCQRNPAGKLTRSVDDVNSVYTTPNTPETETGRTVKFSKFVDSSSAES